MLVTRVRSAIACWQAVKRNTSSEREKDDFLRCESVFRTYSRCPRVPCSGQCFVRYSGTRSTICISNLTRDLWALSVAEFAAKFDQMLSVHKGDTSLMLGGRKWNCKQYCTAYLPDHSKMQLNCFQQLPVSFMILCVLFLGKEIGGAKEDTENDIRGECKKR